MRTNSTFKNGMVYLTFPNLLLVPYHRQKTGKCTIMPCLLKSHHLKSISSMYKLIPELAEFVIDERMTKVEYI